MSSMEVEASLPGPVCSHTEWDPLEEVIVGSLDGASVPPWHVVERARGLTGVAGVALRALAGRRYPWILRRNAQRELDGLVRLLESEGVRVRRPDPMDFTRRAETPFWSSTGFCAASPRDLLMVVGDQLIEAASPWRARYFEGYVYRSLLKEYFRGGARWTAAPKPQLSDALYDADYSPPRPGEAPRHVINEWEPVFETADFARCGAPARTEDREGRAEPAAPVLLDVGGLVEELVLQQQRGEGEGERRERARVIAVAHPEEHQRREGRDVERRAREGDGFPARPRGVAPPRGERRRRRREREGRDGRREREGREGERREGAREGARALAQQGVLAGVAVHLPIGDRVEQVPEGEDARARADRRERAPRRVAERVRPREARERQREEMRPLPRARVGQPARDHRLSPRRPLSAFAAAITAAHAPRAKKVFTDTLGASVRTWCHQRLGSRRVSPGPRSTVSGRTRARRGKRRRSIASGSTRLPLGSEDQGAAG